MLDATLIGNAIVSALQSIPALVSAMNNDATRIKAFHYLYGSDEPLLTAIFQMEPPGILVAWEGSGPGGYRMAWWEHKFGCYFRIANVAGEESPIGPESLWQIMMDSAVNGGSLNIRKVALLSNLQPMTRTPTVEHRADLNGIDYFCGHMDFDEIGDS